MAICELTAEFIGEIWRSDKEPCDFIIGEALVCDSERPKSIIIKGTAAIGELRRNQVYVFLGQHKKYFNKFKGAEEDQFAFNSFIRQEPVTPEAVISYITQHGEGHGIGARRAAKLYELFGSEAIAIARDQPERIIESLARERLRVDPDDVQLFSQSLKREQSTERTRLDLTGLLTGRGFYKSVVSAAIAKWGIKAGYLIKRDPYKLMRLNNVGAGFKRCDSVYLDMGLPPARRKRQALCAWYSIARDTSGSTWFPIDYPNAFLKANISGAEVNAEMAITLATRAKYLTEIRTNSAGEIDKEGSRRWFAETKKVVNEATIANIIVKSRSEKLIWPTGRIADISDHQQTELSKSLQTPIGILGGGPGTGKTWTVASLVKHAIGLIGEDSIGIGAPTGKAAVRVTENLASRQLQLRARTWHSLLMDPKNIQGKKILIGDESSMNDTDLMASIMRHRPVGCHLLLVGDVNQLPPVGHGAPFRDLINAGVSYGELKEIKRNSGGIVEACKAIREGTPWDASDNLIIDECKNPEQQIQRVLHWLDQAPKNGLNPMWDCQVVVAVNDKSELSKKSLNPILQSHLNRLPGVDRIPFRVDDKIVNTQNGYVKLLESNDFDDSVILNERGEVYVANGEQAKVVEISRDRFVAELQSPYRVVEIFFRKQNEQAAAHGESDESIDASDVTEKTATGCNWDLAYSISVHKSQGSDWPWTIILLDGYAGARRICDRSWIYTAISRAKSKCILIGSRKTAFSMARVSNIHQRKTFLREQILYQSSAYQLAEV